MGINDPVFSAPPLPPSPVAFPPVLERQPTRAMGSRCAKLSTGHSRGYESPMKKLVACVSQDNFSLSSEGEGEEGGEEEEDEEVEEEEDEEELPVQGKLLLIEDERQEKEGAEEEPAAQQSPEPKQTHS
uniref:Protamine 3 n=4 Tax=Felinae TaxID=338152 RepID=A0ABI7W994_FELCA